MIYVLDKLNRGRCDTYVFMNLSIYCVFRSPKWPARHNKRLHLKMLSFIEEEQTKVNLPKYSVLKNLVSYALKILNIDRLKLIPSKHRPLQDGENSEVKEDMCQVIVVFIC